MKYNVPGLAAILLAVAFSSFTIHTNKKNLSTRYFAYNQDIDRWEYVPASSFDEGSCLSGGKICLYETTDDSFNPTNSPLSEADINNAGSKLTPLGSLEAHYDF